VGSLPSTACLVLNNYTNLWQHRVLTTPQYLVGLFGFLALLAIWSAPVAMACLLAFSSLPLAMVVRWRSCVAASRRLGLKTLVLVPMSPWTASRLYGVRLPSRIRNVADAHVDTGVSWLQEGCATGEAICRFKEALADDYSLVIRLLDGSPDWAFCITTWHKVPESFLSTVREAERQGSGCLKRGIVPGWLASIGEAARVRSQKRMFGAEIGLPVGDPGRWNSYFLEGW